MLIVGFLWLFSVLKKVDLCNQEKIIVVFFCCTGRLGIFCFCLSWLFDKTVYRIVCNFFLLPFSRYYAIHRDVYKWFDISFDEFGRTSSPQQTEVCQAIFKKLLENNWLSENTMQQVWLELVAWFFLFTFGLWVYCAPFGIILLVLAFFTNSYLDSALLWYLRKVLSWSACRGQLSYGRL